jgi:hypothetical protein
MAWRSHPSNVWCCSGVVDPLGCDPYSGARVIRSPAATLASHVDELGTTETVSLRPGSIRRPGRARYAPNGNSIPLVRLHGPGYISIVAVKKECHNTRIPGGAQPCSRDS